MSEAKYLQRYTREAGALDASPRDVFVLVTSTDAVLLVESYLQPLLPIEEPHVLLWIPIGQTVAIGLEERHSGYFSPQGLVVVQK